MTQSNDLKDRLRRKERACGFSSKRPGTLSADYEDDPLTTEAADRIEVLEAALREDLRLFEINVHTKSRNDITEQERIIAIRQALKGNP